jgi:hypothetical protein
VFAVEDVFELDFEDRGYCKRPVRLLAESRAEVYSNFKKKTEKRETHIRMTGLCLLLAVDCIVDTVYRS